MPETSPPTPLGVIAHDGRCLAVTTSEVWAAHLAQMDVFRTGRMAHIEVMQEVTRGVYRRTNGEDRNA